MIEVAVAIAVFMVVMWSISVAIRDASIVDIGWGTGFVIVGWTARRVLGAEAGPRSLLLTVLVTLWGLRLAGYLAWRNLGNGEDYRYVKMRRYWGRRFPFVSLVTVFGLQGVLMFIVSLPVQWGQFDNGRASLGVLAGIGTVTWLVGMAFETIGDVQLARFKSDPANKAKVMNTGLWAWTRHPNYFGDACVWWGLGLIAAESGSLGVASLVGPVCMTVLLVKVSGKDLLERNLVKRREGYADYIRSTSGFVPRRPQRN